MSAVRSVANADTGAALLIALVPYLSPKDRETVLRERLSAVKAYANERQQSVGLTQSGSSMKPKEKRGRARQIWCRFMGRVMRPSAAR